MVAKVDVNGTLAIRAFVMLCARSMASDEAFGEELGNDMSDVAHVDLVDDRLSRGIS